MYFRGVLTSMVDLAVTNFSPTKINAYSKYMYMYVYMNGSEYIYEGYSEISWKRSQLFSVLAHYRIRSN